MTTAVTSRVTEIARFTTQVYAALSHLLEPVRTELVDDLPEHLAEITADTSSPLEELLGTPQAYAAELCATAGLPVAGAPAPSLDLAATVRQLDTRIGGWLGYPRLRDFLVALRPAWWAARGAVVGFLVMGVVLVAMTAVDTPLVLLLGPASLAGVGVSVRLGRIHASLPDWARAAVIAGNGMLALGAILLFAAGI
ncbi:MAG: hypothetical protein ACRDT6_26400 [Micromonosporaceae bacterium]